MSDSKVSPDWLPQYQALTERLGFVVLDRTQIELAGDDRASFLHNLCTSEIKKLRPGEGCEAFFTSVQGKTLGHGFIFVVSDSIVIDTVAGQAETLLAHLDHYLVCERVKLNDRSDEWLEVLVTGPQAEALLSRLWHVQLEDRRLAHTSVESAGRRIHARRVDMTPGGGFLLSVNRADGDWLQSVLTEAGAVRSTPEAFNAARIEEGTPLFGQDLNDKNLPQELGRDNQAISFVKGCYLGQETVARLDALGHVNKSLVGVQIKGGEIPPVGSELKTGDLVVGQITSATYSPRLKFPLALAFVRQAQSRAGTVLSTSVGEAQVIELPVA